MVYVIVTSRSWYEDLPGQIGKETGQRFVLITKKEDLTFERLKELSPRYVFFPHWSSLIPDEIYNNFECVIFHMTDLPFGRGGSPLQNLISRGIYETKISALRCEAGIDSGPIYMKEPLSLEGGTAEEIFLRTREVVRRMILSIMRNEPDPTPQSGESVRFNRLKPQDGNIAEFSDLNKVFDFIRMLDANGYPKAFLETEHLRFEFQRASLKQDAIISDVVITRKEGDHEQ